MTVTETGVFDAWQVTDSPVAAAHPDAIVGAVLGFSFSLETGSIALRTPDGQVFERILEGHRSHAGEALQTVRDLMSQAGLAPADIAAVAADVGPGGFTGLRTACGLAQGLAVGWNRPCVAVSSLSLMAFDAFRQTPQDAICVAALDARQQEVYVAAWQLSGGSVTPLMAPALRPYGADALQAINPSVSVLAVGPGIAHLQFGERASISRDESLIPRASALVHIAAQALTCGATLPPVQCQPLYVRQRVALTTAQRQARAGA